MTESPGSGRWDEDIEWSPSSGPRRGEPPAPPEPSQPAPRLERSAPAPPVPRPSGRAASRPSSRPAGVSRSKLIAASLATFVAGGLLGYLLRSNPPVPDPQTLQQTLPVVTVTVEAEAAP